MSHTKVSRSAHALIEDETVSHKSKSRHTSKEDSWGEVHRLRKQARGQLTDDQIVALDRAKKPLPDEKASRAATRMQNRLFLKELKEIKRGPYDILPGEALLRKPKSRHTSREKAELRKAAKAERDAEKLAKQSKALARKSESLKNETEAQAKHRRELERKAKDAKETAKSAARRAAEAKRAAKKAAK